VADSLGEWNCLYGRAGLIQYQLVIPAGQESALVRCFELIRARRIPVYLAELKWLGASFGGPLSFLLAGLTLAIDIPASAPGLAAALDARDTVVAECGGRVYLSKDVRLRPEVLAAMYPRLDSFHALRSRADPGGVLGSDLARRVGLCPGALMSSAPAGSAGRRVIALGGYSEIALATVRELQNRSPREVVLVGRDPGALTRAAEDVRLAGSPRVVTLELDALNTERHAEVGAAAFDAVGGGDIVILAVGLLGERGGLPADVSGAVGVLLTNVVAAGSLLLLAARRLRDGDVLERSLTRRSARDPSTSDRVTRDRRLR
jgi:hypothetical protein